MALVAATAGAYAQTTVSGTVTSAADNEPLIGATVQVVGAPTGVSTDLDGQYTVKAEMGQTLRFSYIGMEAQEVKITSTTINVALKENSNVLDEVVVVGYGTVRKSDLTSSISTVKGEEITEMTTGNAMDALQGKVNGVQITSGGGPGTQPRVIIRGVTTVNGSNPLYVVDGMPVGNDINFLNPSDVESMEVLKDASAAAIYGTRGSNGVILITTKKGAAGKIGVNFSANVGFQTINDPKMAGAAEYERVMKARYTNDGRSPQWNSPYNDYTDDMGTDWWNTVINKTALVQNYQLGISGGNEKYTFAASVGYFRNNSQYDMGYWDKLTINLNTEYRFNKYVQAGLQIAPRTESWEDTPNQFGSAMAMDPTTPCLKAPEDRGENAYNDYVRSYNNQVWNPLGSLSRPAPYSRNYGVLLNPYLQIVPVEGLTLRTQFGLNGVVTRTDTYNPEFNIDALEKNTNSEVTRRMYENVDWNWTNTANYMKTFAKVHNLNVMIGFTAEKFGYWNVKGTGLDIPNDSETLRELDSATTGMKAEGTSTSNTLVSYLGRVMYNFDQRYYITASVRVDGSSRFPKGNKYATFPAVSGAWRLSEEHFMEDVDWLDNLKIRAGWGKVGNQAIGNSDFLTLLGSTYTVIGGQRVPGYVITDVGNNRLKWETVEDWNVGIDASLFNSRLDLTFDYFKKRSHDMLYNKNVFKYMGYPKWPSSVMMNIGEMEAAGWEVGATWRDRVGDFRYEIGVNLSGVRNKAIKLTGDGPVDVDFSRSEDGGLIGRFFGYQTDGLFQNRQEIDNWIAAGNGILQNNVQPGDVKFVDQNHDGVINDDDKVNLGNGVPKFTYGFNINLYYKNFDLGLTATGAAGNKIVQTYRNQTDMKASYTTEILGRWTGEGTSNRIPRVTNSNINWQFSDLYVHDGDFLRLSNLTVGYNFAPIMNQKWCSQCRLYFQVQNLATFTKYNGMDPEIGYGTSDWVSGIDVGYYPRPRTFLIGVNLTL